MNKAVLIMIGICYVASILLISIFGMQVVVLNNVVPVTKVTCTNETDPANNVRVDRASGETKIYVTFTEPGDEASMTGTMLFLTYDVAPDNASSRRVRFEYDRDKYTQVKFITDQDGNELGLIMFQSPVLFRLTLVAMDGSNQSDSVLISARR